ncbi:myosin-16 [Abeliophyllum distichum]|uniref:Myosin-16 n=1 Tax=Abeliophyllum distichum TaxID=126358 RepID=A0ABD1R9J2_9LAMI
MLANHGREGSSTGEDGDKDEFFPVAPVEGATESDDDSVNQVDHGDPTNGAALHSIQNESNDSSAAEDGGREDMFVDCPDEMETSESLQSFEDHDEVQDTQFEESDNGIKVGNLMAEIQQLRDMLAEKDRFAQEYEEERAAFTRELAHLCHQVKALNKQRSLLGENGVRVG